LFERAHHVRIAAVLGALDAALLEANECWFGGGTAIVLRHGEFRESLDVDFLVSSDDGYRQLRLLVNSPQGLQALARPGAALETIRPPKVDRYGIRGMLEVQGASIKLEIVSEGRIELESPGPEDRVCGIATLTRLDMATSKLLANADRWADDATLSRDLIDLAMMDPTRELFDAALAKAGEPYPDVGACFVRATDALLSRHGRLHGCLRTLKMQTPPAVVYARLETLRRWAGG